MSMATSLETRAPFLDATCGAGLLDARRSQDTRRVRKFVLKNARSGIPCRRRILTAKEGFSIPMKNWLRSELSR